MYCLLSLLLVYQDPDKVTSCCTVKIFLHAAEFGGNHHILRNATLIFSFISGFFGDCLFIYVFLCEEFSEGKLRVQHMGMEKDNFDVRWTPKMR